MEHAQKLLSTRRGSFYIAAIAALVAGAAILVYLNGYRHSLKSNAAAVTVLVARTTIPKGTSGSVIASKALFTATTIRESQLRDGALSDPQSLKGKVTSQEIYEGSQLTADEFAPSGSSLAGTLAAAQRIVTIPLDSAHGLIGDISAGDHVDIYAGFNVIPLRADGTPVAGGQARALLRRIMTDVSVVAVNGSDAASGSKTSNVGLRVNDRQAAQLAFASDNGKVWLSLRPSTGGTSTKPGIVSVETLLLGMPPVTVVHSLGGRS
jgi:Flp pilus assembly protein CpaB